MKAGNGTGVEDPDERVPVKVSMTRGQRMFLQSAADHDGEKELARWMFKLAMGQAGKRPPLDQLCRVAQALTVLYEVRDEFREKGIVTGPILMRIMAIEEILRKGLRA